MVEKFLHGALVGLGLAIISVVYYKLKKRSEEKNKNKKKNYWVCPNCSQKNFNSKDICGNCKTPKPENN